MSAWLAGYFELIAPLVDWLIDWLIDWMVDWLVGWISWLMPLRLRPEGQAQRPNLGTSSDTYIISGYLGRYHIDRRMHCPISFNFSVGDVGCVPGLGPKRWDATLSIGVEEIHVSIYSVAGERVQTQVQIDYVRLVLRDRQ